MALHPLYLLGGLMAELDLKEIIGKSLEEIEKEALEKLSTLPSFKNTPQIRALIGEIKEKLQNYFNTGEGKEEIAKKFIYKQLPYTITQKFLETVKVKILERIVVERGATQEELKSLKERFKELENEIAKVYLRRDVEELRDIKNSKFKKYALFKAHADYIERIIEAVQSSDLSKFPLESYSKSTFKKSINFPESVMACMNAYFCDYLENLEKSVFKAAKAFFILLKQENYPEAYLAFKELKELALKVSNKMAELYFLAFTNGESNFVKLIEYLAHIYPKRMVAAIDFADLRGLNQLLTEAKVNRMLEKAHKTLHQFFNQKVEKFLVVRGISHNFFVLGVNTTPEEFAQTLKEASKALKERLEKEGLPFQSFRVFGFLMDERFNGFENRVNNFLNHIKERAKRENASLIILYKEKELQELLEWQKEQFRKVSFIRERLSPENIVVVFQPIVKSDSQKIEALETLFRLKDGDSLIPPGILIDVIYELNLMTYVDVIVLEKLLEQKKLLGEITKKLFINVSPQSLTNRTYLDKLDTFVKEMADFSIYLEITEQKLLENACELKELSRRYPNLKFAIDDFGSGYSSFKLVIDLAENKTLEVLKLDGSYTKKIAQSDFTKKVIRAISALSKSLGIKTVAEFVEDGEIAEVLRGEGIDLLQGYFLSRPKIAEEIIYQLEKINSP